jgi:hypothetical protein
MLANVGNPVTILAASCCICSILFKSKIVQPSHSSHAYSNNGLKWLVEFNPQKTKCMLFSTNQGNINPQILFNNEDV